MARLFVAVWPPSEVLDRLEHLPRASVHGVRWTTREQWHVTLRFLGDADIDTAVTALRAVDHPCVTAAMGEPVGRLGAAVLIAPVRGLTSLADEVRRVTSAVGVPPDDRPFLGHLTLARLKNRPSCGLLGERIDASWSVTEVALVRSTTGRSGAVYETVATQPLASRTTIG